MILPPTSSKEIAMRLVSAAENSSLRWKEQYQYIEYNVEGNNENRGYTGGIVGFTSKTGDMLEVVKRFEELAKLAKLAPSPLEQLHYIDALVRVNGTHSKEGLGKAFEDAWRSVDNDPKYRVHFRAAQDEVRDTDYFNPAVKKAHEDRLRTLGQFIYYDAWVMHGGDKALSIRKIATDEKKTPTEGGDETEYLHAFLDARREAMLKEDDHKDNVDRVDSMQRIFLILGNLELNLPLTFRVNEETFTIAW